MAKTKNLKKKEKEQSNERKSISNGMAGNKQKKKSEGGRKQLKSLSDHKSKQYAIGSAAPDSNVHYYKFTGKQTKSWKPVGKQLKDYLYHLIDSGVRMVGSRPQFTDNEDVQALLNDLKLLLKAKLHTIRVPNKRRGNYSKIKAQTDELTADLEQLTNQQLQLEKAIREEERAIENLEDIEDTSDSVKLKIKVPEDTLDLPKFLF